MENLISLTRQLQQSGDKLAFSIYHCKHKQSLRCVPIFKPTVVFVLSGEKHLGAEMNASAQSGQFIFLSENPDVTLSNIPGDRGYLALFIEFEHADFSAPDLDYTSNSKRFLIGDIKPSLLKSISQFIQWCQSSPPELWHSRRKELIQLLYFYGYSEIFSMLSRPKIHHQLTDVFKQNPAIRWDIKDICQNLAMSESTLRRKLKLEGTRFRDLQTQVRLAHGMHLLQTTDDNISAISEKCGYQSQSRFTERFKDRFGLTPKKLRQTKLTETG